MTKTPHRLLLAGVVLTLGLLIPTRAAAQTTDEGRLFVRGYGGVQWSGPDSGIADKERSELVGGGLGWNLTHNFAVIGDVGYMTNVVTTNGTLAFNHVVSLITLVYGDADVSLDEHTLFVLGGARYTMGSGGVRLFVEGQGGTTRATYKLNLSSVSSGVVDGLLLTTSSTAPAVAAAGGADIRLSRRLSAEGAYRYMRLFGDAKANVHQVFGGLKVAF